MAAIDQFLIDNPDLKGKDPKRVADFVYKTQGFEAAGKDRARFDEFFLGKPEPSMMGRVGDFVGGAADAIGGAIGDAYGAVKGAVQGDAAFPDVQGAKLGSLKEAAASAMGSDEDWANAILAENPDSQLAEDKNGNLMILHPDKPMEYVNKPGLDTRDVGRFGMKAAAFTPAGKATSMAAGAGLAARAGTAAVTAGATDAAMQQGVKMAGGKDEIDLGQVGMTAALGAGAEGASRAVEGALRWAKGKYGNKAWRSMSDKRKGQVIARRVGIDNLTGSQYRDLGKLDKLDQADEAKIADVVFGFKQTRGQAMPEGKAKIKQMNTEEALLQMPDGHALKNQVDQNYQKLKEAPEKFADMFSGGARLGKTRNESAEIVKDKLVQVKDEMETAFKATYKEAADSDVNYMDAAVQKIPEFLRKTMQGKDDVLMTKTGTPKAMEALDHIESSIAEWTKDSYPLDKSKFTVGLRQMEQLRKDLNQLMRQTSKIEGGDDRRVLRMVQKELSGVVERMGEASLFKGDPQGIKLQKQANRMFADYAGKFRDGSKAGKIVQKIVDDDTPPENVAEFMFGASGLGNREAANVVKAYKRIVGRDSEALSALKETYFYSNVRGRGENALGPQAMMNQVKEMLLKKGESTVNELYDPAEITAMKQFVRAIDKTFDMRPSSGTAERGTRIASILSRGVPGPLTFLFQAVSDVASMPIQRAKAAMATKIPNKVGALPKLPSTLPATGAIATSQ